MAKIAPNTLCIGYAGAQGLTTGYSSAHCRDLQSCSQLFCIQVPQLLYLTTVTANFVCAVEFV